MVRKIMMLIIAGGLSLGVSGCNTGANSTPQPPNINYGEAICEFCGMIVSEERFAAGYLLADEQEKIFDDIGDMVQAHRQEKTEVTASFVHDYTEHTWIRAETAVYVQSDQLTTPMLSGLAAFSTREAVTDAGLSGPVMTFDELLADFIPPMKGMKMDAMDTHTN